MFLKYDFEIKCFKEILFERGLSLNDDDVVKIIMMFGEALEREGSLPKWVMTIKDGGYLYTEIDVVKKQTKKPYVRLTIEKFRNQIDIMSDEYEREWI